MDGRTDGQADCTKMDGCIVGCINRGRDAYTNTCMQTYMWMGGWVDEGVPPDAPALREPFGTSRPTSSSVARTGDLAPDRSSWLKSIMKRKPLGVEGQSRSVAWVWRARAEVWPGCGGPEQKFGLGVKGQSRSNSSVTAAVQRGQGGLGCLGGGTLHACRSKATILFTALEKYTARPAMRRGSPRREGLPVALTGRHLQARVVWVGACLEARDDKVGTGPNERARAAHDGCV
eukprot:366400-Chlamydomonas_euryale.AAC.4